MGRALSPVLLAAVGVALVSAASLLGVLGLAGAPERAQRRARGLIGFAIGALLGDVFLHLLPEALAQLSFQRTSVLVLAGWTLFFTLERVLRHDSLHHRWHHLSPIVGVNLVGDGLHNVLDGMVIAASFQVDPALGLATTLAVLFHEIPQELGDFAILVHGGLPVRRALRLNLLSALAAFVGVAVVGLFGLRSQALAVALVPVTAGCFLYLAGTDLAPELHHERSLRSAVRDLVAIAAGVALMAALARLE
jgi:zinc and cadmium transporter